MRVPAWRTHFFQKQTNDVKNVNSKRCRHLLKHGLAIRFHGYAISCPSVKQRKERTGTREFIRGHPLFSLAGIDFNVSWTNSEAEASTLTQTQSWTSLHRREGRRRAVHEPIKEIVQTFKGGQGYQNQPGILKWRVYFCSCVSGY